jgi:hypothetical protein
MNSLERTVRVAAHAAALVFGSFWLVATSAPAPGPPRDCFTGIANPTRLAVVLGPAQASTSVAASCAGLDGLAPDRTIVFDLSQGPRPKSQSGCYDYATLALSGTIGVTTQPEAAAWSGGDSLTGVRGAFASLDQPACRADYWWLSLAPVAEPAEGEVISPLDAGSARPWILERSMGIEQAQFCGDLFAAPGAVGCSDRFSIVSITEVTP